MASQPTLEREREREREGENERADFYYTSHESRIVRPTAAEAASASLKADSALNAAAQGARAACSHCSFSLVRSFVPPRQLAAFATAVQT